MEAFSSEQPDPRTTEPLDEAYLLQPGDRVGTFEIEERIKEGGWGYVFAAHATTNGRRVAVKTIKPGLARRPAYRRRFEVEQKALAKLPGHPNLSPPLDWNKNESEGLLWLAMRWIEGRDLYEVVGRKPLKPAHAAHLIAQAAEGLELVHKKTGLAHRDIHPGNLMVESDDHLLVIDFGLAKRFGHPSGSPAQAVESEWASPEGWRGEEMTPQSDVYSLGLVLAYLLTAKTPFAAGPQFPTHLAVPVGLRTIVERATRPNLETTDDGEGRTKTAGDLASQLRRYLRSEEASSPPATPPQPAPRGSRRAIPALLLAVLAAVVSVAVFLAVNGIASSVTDNYEGSKVAAAGITFTLPDAWRPASVSAADRKLGMEKAAASSDTLVLIGPIERAQVPGYSSARKAVEVNLPAGRALRAEDDRTLKARMLYVFHAGGAFPALVCRGIYGASIAAVKGDCEAIARSLSVVPRPTAITYPSMAVQRQAKGALERYAMARKKVTARIRVADTHGEVATTAFSMAKTTGRIALSLRAPQLAPLQAAFDQVRTAWQKAATAARRQRGFHGAGKEVAAAEDGIRRARRELLKLGYRG